jgi:hypothetical protein
MAEVETEQIVRLGGNVAILAAIALRVRLSEVVPCERKVGNSAARSGPCGRVQPRRPFFPTQMEATGAPIAEYGVC